jgi:thioesterase domain-containing protein/acyl carrier protein
MSSNEQTNLSDVALEKKLLGMWRRFLQNDTLTIDDDFFECGGDSVLALEVLLEIEQLTGKSLARSILFETGSIRQLVKKLISTDKEQPQGSVMVGSGPGKIIHFFHGDVTWGGLLAKKFSTMLGDDYRVHAVHPHVPVEGVLPTSIEDMAKGRVQRIFEKQLDGPYTLIGYCNGALVAFEVARHLVTRGKEVNAVVMIDPAIMSTRRSAQLVFAVADFAMRLAGVEKNTRRERQVDISKKLLRIDRKMKDFWRRPMYRLLKKRPPKRSSDKSHRLKKLTPNEQEALKIKRRYFDIFFDYRPLPLDVPVLFIALSFSGYAWRRISKNTAFINMFRGYHNPWDETYAQYLVDEIKKFINR